MMKRYAVLIRLTLCGVLLACGAKANAAGGARSTPRLDPAPTVAIYHDSTHRSYITLPIIEAK